MPHKIAIVAAIEPGDEVNILELTSLTSMRLRDTFTDPLGELSVSVGVNRSTIANVLKYVARGSRVTATVDGAPQFCGTIQSIKRGTGRSGASVSFVAKSILAEPFRGHVNPNLRLHTKGDTAVEETISEALAPFSLGPDGLTILDFTTGLDKRSQSMGKPWKFPSRKKFLSSLKTSDLKPQQGQSAYAFISGFLSRMGVMLRPSAYPGQVIITYPEYDGDPPYGVAEGYAATDKFFTPVHDDWEFSESNEQGFSEVTIWGNKIDVAGKKQAAPDQVRVLRPPFFLQKPGYTAADDKIIRDGVEKKLKTKYYKQTLTADKMQCDYPQYVSTFAPYVPYIIQDKRAKDSKACVNSAYLEFAKRAQHAVSLPVRVTGFASRNGFIWQTNTLCQAKMPTADIDSTMWVFERTFSHGPDGQYTDLTLLPKNALFIGEIPE